MNSEQPKMKGYEAVACLLTKSVDRSPYGVWRDAFGQTEKGALKKKTLKTPNP